MAATMHRCKVCTCIMPKSRKHRATCGDAACYSIHKSNIALANPQKTPNRADWARELEPWPEGVSFSSMDETPNYARVPRPITHVPYESSASWAV